MNSFPSSDPDVTEKQRDVLRFRFIAPVPSLNLGSCDDRTALARVIHGELVAVSHHITCSSPARSKVMTNPSVCVFDVNGSLIDVDSMAPFFQKIFGDGIKLARIWYDNLILYASVIASSGSYPGTFIELSQAVLQMVASVYHVELRPADIDDLRTQILSMRVFPDVPDGLHMLKDAGFRLATLTNSPPGPQGSEFQLSQAGIADLFDRHFNTASVRSFKVAPSAYHMVAEQMDVPMSACCMITAHQWDALGAQFVGYSSALMHRPGQASLPMRGLPQPLAVAQDLPGVAAQLIKLRHQE